MFVEGVNYEEIGFRKYRLLTKLVVDTGISPPDGKEVRTKFGFLSVTGILTLYPGYQWDGATGAIDTISILRASALHDWFCLHVITRKLPPEYRRKGDDLFYLVCIEDGMPKIRADYAHAAVIAYGMYVVATLDE